MDRWFGWARLGGVVTVLVLALAPAGAAASPDGLIVVSRQVPTGGAEIILVEPDGSGEVQVQVAGVVEDWGSATWSPDGSKLLLANNLVFDADGNCCVAFRPVVVNPDGSGYEQMPVGDLPIDMYCRDWTGDATRTPVGLLVAGNPGEGTRSTASRGPARRT